jgi:ABC-type oligopeptide transport system substrate-binding subunit
MKRPSCIILWLSFLTFGLAGAQIVLAETPLPPPFGIAMHGAPKYNETATHLSYANPDAPRGGRLKIASIGSFDTLNPFSIKGKPAEGLGHITDRLMVRVWDEPFTLYPLIAERMDVAPDRSAVTFHLNALARFDDDSPILADDVIFSFETLRDEGRPNMRRIYGLVEKAEKLDERTVRFTLGEGYDRETVMILGIMPVFSKTFWEDRTFDETILQTPLTNGPYRIKAFEPGRFITYERVIDHWANHLFTNIGHYNFDEITYEYYRDDTVALQAFEKGNLDLRREYDISKWVLNYKNLGPDFMRSEIAHQRPERVRSFIYNMRRAPFDSIEVRKALLLAFDDQWIGKNIFFDRFDRIDSVFPNSALSGAGPSSPQVLSLLEPWRAELPTDVFAENFNILPTEPNMRERLKQADLLLKNAGWIVENGKRMRDGKPFSFELMIASPEDEKIAINFQKSLQRLGITMNVRTMDTASFQDRLKLYDFDMVSYFWQNTLSPGTEQVQYWSCESAKQEARWNFPGLCLPALDHLALAIAGTADYEALTSHAQAIDRVIMSQIPMIPLFHPKADYVAHKSSINKPTETPIYGAVLETWWMDQPKDANQD